MLSMSSPIYIMSWIITQTVAIHIFQNFREDAAKVRRKSDVEYFFNSLRGNMMKCLKDFKIEYFV